MVDSSPRSLCEIHSSKFPSRFLSGEFRVGPCRLGTCDAHDHLQPIAITRQGIQQTPDLRDRVNKDCEIWPKVSSLIAAKIKTCFQGHRMNYLLHLWELKNNAMPLGPRLASPYPLPSEV